MLKILTANVQLKFVDSTVRGWSCVANDQVCDNNKVLQLTIKLSYLCNILSIYMSRVWSCGPSFWLNFQFGSYVKEVAHY